MIAVARAAPVLLSTFALISCVTPFPPELVPENREVITKVFVNAYEEVTESYIRRVEPGELAVAALANLQQIEPALSVESEDDVISLRLSGKEVYSFHKPAAVDIEGWANATGDALVAARSYSGALRALSGKGVLENQMEGIAASLAGGASYSAAGAWREVLMPRYDGGIYFSYRFRESGVEVWRLDPDGRLAAEGLRKGDTITHVNFAPIAGLSGWDLRNRLVGPVGSSVTLTVRRGDAVVPTELRLTRWKGEAWTYQMERHGGVAVFKLPYLNARATHELKRALGTELRKARYDQTTLEGLVLDLRGNLGSGELDLTDLANSFLGKGTISTQRNWRPEPRRTINASWPDHSQNLPLVVLVDGITGYGAEDVAAALQDHGRALVIGSSTRGDGVVRENVSLFNMGDIWMPVAFSHAPSGYGLTGRGVMPHICTSSSNDSASQLLAALRQGRGIVSREIIMRHTEPHDADALAAHRAVCPPQEDEAELPLDLAVAILRDSALYAQLMEQAARR